MTRLSSMIVLLSIVIGVLVSFSSSTPITIHTLNVFL
jgi:hypothetical protein